MNHRTGKLTMHDFDPSHDAGQRTGLAVGMSL